MRTQIRNPLKKCRLKSRSNFNLQEDTNASASTPVEHNAPAEAEAQPIEFEKIPVVEETSSEESPGMQPTAPEVVSSQAASPPTA